MASGAREEGPVDRGSRGGAAGLPPPSQAPASSTQPLGLRLETTWALPVREPPTLRAASLSPSSSPRTFRPHWGN